MRIRSLILAAATAVLLTGCTSVVGPFTLVDDPSISASPSTSPSPSATPSEAPVATPEAPSDASPTVALTCPDLLDAAAQERFTAAAADGWAGLPDVAQQTVDEGGLPARFTANDGVFCLWGIPGSDAYYSAAFSVTSSDERAQVEAGLATEGAAVTPAHGGTQHCIPPEGSGPADPGYEECYLFVDDHWFFATDSTTFPMLLTQTGVG